MYQIEYVRNYFMIYSMNKKIPPKLFACIYSIYHFQFKCIYTVAAYEVK